MAESPIPTPGDVPVDETREERLARIRIFDRDRVKDQYCAFVDILGFGAATQNNLSQVLDLYEALLEDARFLSQLSPNVHIEVYSDSFVVTSEHLPPVIETVRMLHWQVLFRNYLVRGGIAVGLHADGQKGSVKFIVSAAVSKAVSIEKTVGWPCIALHSDVIVPDEWWLAEGRPLIYFDGLRIVNPFSRYFFRSAMIRASNLLEKYPVHAAKYEWFLKLYAAVDSGDSLIPQEVIERLHVKYPGMIKGNVHWKEGPNS